MAARTVHIDLAALTSAVALTSVLAAPAYAGAAEVQETAQNLDTAQGGSASMLIVDDEPGDLADEGRPSGGGDDGEEASQGEGVSEAVSEESEVEEDVVEGESFEGESLADDATEPDDDVVPGDDVASLGAAELDDVPAVDEGGSFAEGEGAALEDCDVVPPEEPSDSSRFDAEGPDSTATEDLEVPDDPANGDASVAEGCVSAFDGADDGALADELGEADQPDTPCPDADAFLADTAATGDLDIENPVDPAEEAGVLAQGDGEGRPLTGRDATAPEAIAAESEQVVITVLPAPQSIATSSSTGVAPQAAAASKDADSEPFKPLADKTRSVAAVAGGLSQEAATAGTAPSAVAEASVKEKPAAVPAPADGDAATTEPPVDVELAVADSAALLSSSVAGGTAAEGPSKSGWVKEGGSWYYYDPSTGKPKTGWLQAGGDWYYLDAKTGAMRTGWVKPGDAWYYLRESGKMATGWVRDGDDWYLTSDSGAMKKGWAQVKDNWYYLRESGKMATGWVKPADAWYYLNDAGAMKTGWIHDGDAWYLTNGSGAMKTGWANYDGATYYLKSSGKMATGWVEDGASWYYMQPSGKMAKGWAKAANAKWYYLDPNSGAMLTGERNIDGKHYYLKPNGAMAQHEFAAIPDSAVAGGKRTMFFNGSGAMTWMVINGYCTYYDGATGAQVFGEHYTPDAWNRGWHYFDPTTGVMVINKFQYINDNGARSGKIVYCGQNGEMYTGYRSVLGVRYHFNESTRALDSSTYMSYFTNAGLADRAQGYWSPTDNLITVNLSSHVVSIYEGWQGNWREIRSMRCGNGAAATPTPTGVYSIGDKGYYFDSDENRCFYYSQISGPYLFHSVLYERTSTPQYIRDPSLGVSVSHGCVRLALEDAYYIYSNIPRGTTIAITY